MDEMGPSLAQIAVLLALAPVGAWAAQSAAAAEEVAPRPDLLRPSTSFLAVVAALHLSALMIEPLWLALASLALLWALIALAWIDWKLLLLPNFLTLPLIPAGLAVAWAQGGEAPLDQAIGAAAGFLALAGAAAAYRAMRKTEGLGLGDAKLLAAGGAWLGWAGLPSMLLIAALGALLFLGIERLAGQARAVDDPTPFGPFLAGGLWTVWLLGPLGLG